MDIKGNSLYAQMQSMALEATGNRLPTQMNTQVNQVNNSGSDFANLLSDAVNKVNDVQKEAGEKRTAFELGDQNVTLAETMIAAQKASIAFDATVQVRNKFVEAYKEIMSMPV
ncbi:flagellar hook-basal body complex protein FliE [Thalassotalea sp. LPB0316]|uniref:flagellar hook-basal body complex protein FliE n=1 Tax=Thalassotalea sp. LPB0316 TaxID=2769490 RepID=UPI001866B91A|nr:flagellar hook-basal body complex protein FliE [Thalassotalea sp. LPB0316]QOL27091.1 flagellar hook-basal body complex protein FliE [Thalassotalea sp. LPB0316]